MEAQKLVRMLARSSVHTMTSYWSGKGQRSMLAALEQARTHGLEAALQVTVEEMGLNHIVWVVEWHKTLYVFCSREVFHGDFEHYLVLASNRMDVLSALQRGDYLFMEMVNNDGR